MTYMIHGIGIDLIEIERIQHVLNRQPKVVERILTTNEQQRFHYFTSEQRKVEFLAGRFACKEAFSKALGTGLGKTVAFHDIDCYNDEKGCPHIDYEGYRVHVSISHTEHYATSQVVIETADA